MLHFNWICASVSKMCPQVSEKSERAPKGVKLNVKLCVMKGSDCEQIKTLHIN